MIIIQYIKGILCRENRQNMNCNSGIELVNSKHYLAKGLNNSDKDIWPDTAEAYIIQLLMLYICC